MKGENLTDPPVTQRLQAQAQKIPNIVAAKSVSDVKFGIYTMHRDEQTLYVMKL